jgi:hypothetical protein
MAVQMHLSSPQLIQKFKHGRSIAASKLKLCEIMCTPDDTHKRLLHSLYIVCESSNACSKFCDNKTTGSGLFDNRSGNECRCRFSSTLFMHITLISCRPGPAIAPMHVTTHAALICYVVSSTLMQRLQRSQKKHQFSFAFP